MSKEEKMFEMMKAIAPVFVSKGIELQERIVAAGANPAECTCGGMTILDSQAQSAKEWAEAFVNALNATPKQHDATENEPSDIMDTYNAHNPELVRKINAAWKSGKYNQEFGYIIYSIANRDYNECKEKFDCDMDNFLSSIIDDCDESSIHNVLENVCDDWDLETILSFIRYEE